MHENDPHIKRTTMDETHVTPAPVLVNDTTGPVGPVVVDTEYRQTNYFPYIAVFLLAVLGVWGLMAMNDDDDRLAQERTDVALVQQRLETEPTFDSRAPLQSTSSRVTEDRVRDDMRELRREELARDADRIDDYAAPADTYDNEVAVVDLDDQTQTAPAAATAAATTAETSQSQDAEQVNQEIAVLDLDYSTTPMTALSEDQLDATVEQLDADLDATEDMAKKAGQLAGLEVLDERLDALEDRIEDADSPLNETDRLAITRQLSELRDELTAFQNEIKALN